MITVNAGEAVERFGTSLIGMVVGTYPMGCYPGGMATVIAVNAHPDAPEIVCTVQHPTWRDESSEDGQIGVFEYELLDIDKLDSDVSCPTEKLVVVTS